MKGLLEVGVVFRGFILVNKHLKHAPGLKKAEDSLTDPRGAFISAISSFAEEAFKNVPLEYLESGTLLFIFKVGQIKPSDGISKEPIIMYGLVEKTKKNADKVVKSFLQNVQPLLDAFINIYNEKDFTEADQFKAFKENIIDHFS
jgi:hypothetical protein